MSSQWACYGKPFDLRADSSQSSFNPVNCSFSPAAKEIEPFRQTTRK